MDMSLTDAGAQVSPPLQAHLHGVPVGAFYPGWTAAGDAVRLSDAVWLLPLTEPGTGRHAQWFLGAQGQYLGSHLGRLPPEARAATMLALDYILGPVAQFSLVAPLPDYPAPDPVLSRLNLEIVLHCALVWAQEGLGRIDIVRPEPTSQDEAARRYVGAAAPDFAAAAIDALLHHVVAHHTATTGPAREMLIASPFGDGILRSQVIMSVGAATIHRFADPRRDAVFYLSAMAKADGTIVPGFYCPVARLIVSADPYAALVPGTILAWYALNPDHAAALRVQKPFRPEDFGIGQASALGAPSDIALNVPDTTHDMPAGASGDWLPPPGDTVPVDDDDDRASLVSRVRGWFSRRGS